MSVWVFVVGGRRNTKNSYFRLGSNWNRNTICDNVHSWKSVWKCFDNNRKIHQQSSKKPKSTKINRNYCLIRINKCYTDIRIGIYDGLSCVCMCGFGCGWAFDHGAVLVLHSTNFSNGIFHRIICSFACGKWIKIGFELQTKKGNEEWNKSMI